MDVRSAKTRHAQRGGVRSAHALFASRARPRQRDVNPNALALRVAQRIRRCSAAQLNERRRTSKPSDVIASVTVSQFSERCATLTTLAPARANMSAVVLPIPNASEGGLPAPPTTTTFPARSPRKPPFDAKARSAVPREARIAEVAAVRIITIVSVWMSAFSESEVLQMSD